MHRSRRAPTVQPAQRPNDERASCARARTSRRAASARPRASRGLHGTQSAAALLEGARALRAAPGVNGALDEAMSMDVAA